MSVRTGVNEIFEISKDSVDLWSLLRFLVPALLRDHPDRRGHSRGVETARLLWSFALRDHSDDAVYRDSGEGDLSGHELGTKVIRAWTDHAFGKQTHLHDDHRQGVHIGLIHPFSLLEPYDTPVEKLGGAVTDRAVVVGGRGVD